MDKYVLSSSFIDEMIKVYGYSENDPFIQTMRLYTIPSPFANSKEQSKRMSKMRTKSK